MRARVHTCHPCGSRAVVIVGVFLGEGFGTPVEERPVYVGSEVCAPLPRWSGSRLSI